MLWLGGQFVPKHRQWRFYSASSWLHESCTSALFVEICCCWRMALEEWGFAAQLVHTCTTWTAFTPPLWRRRRNRLTMFSVERMHGTMWTERKPVARSAPTTQLSSCKYRLEVLMSLPRHFIGVAIAANSGMTNRQLFWCVYCNAVWCERLNLFFFSSSAGVYKVHREFAPKNWTT